jgi:hypothetical protein
MYQVEILVGKISQYCLAVFNVFIIDVLNFNQKIGY